MTNIPLATFLASTRCNCVTDNCKNLVFQISKICMQIAKRISTGNLEEDLGKTIGTHNVQDEAQKALDVIANRIFIDTLSNTTHLVAGLASEELPDPIQPHPSQKRGNMLVAFDPLDGSSNIDIHMPVGSIFSILQAPDDLVHTTRDCLADDFLQPGKTQLASGYALYGASCLFVISLGNGTHGFTLHSQSGEFYLTHPNMQIAKQADEYAINTSNYRHWPRAMRQYLDQCTAGVEGVRGRNFNMRWVGAMVADIHRILCRGGVYIYPRDNKIPLKDGRLRLLYETNPMAMLVEQAGGKASTCTTPMLAVQPQSLHQRISVALGSASEIDHLETLYRQYGDT